MNYPLTIVIVIMLVAFVAHMTGGLIQSLTVEPSKVSGGNAAANGEIEEIDRNWVQSMCAFQLVSVDLLVVAGVLYLLAFTDVLAPRQMIGFGVAALFLFWGIAWLVQLAALKRKPKDYLYLGHWTVWFLCAGLVYWGSLSL
jgi:hypothetical protein